MTWKMFCQLTIVIYWNPVGRTFVVILTISTRVPIRVLSLVFILPSELVPGTSRPEGSFHRMQATSRGVPGEMLPGMYVADRKEVSPRLRVRRAV